MNVLKTCGGHLIGFILIAAGIGGNALAAAKYATVGGDFVQDYNAGLAVLSGNSIYESWNDHPPCAALIGAIFSPFSQSHAYVWFTTLGMVLYCAALMMVLKITIPDRFPSVNRFDHSDISGDEKRNDGRGTSSRCFSGVGLRYLIALLFCFWPPQLSNSALGGLSATVSALIMMSWCLLRAPLGGHLPGRILSSGFLALASSIKIYPAIISVSFIVGAIRGCRGARVSLVAFCFFSLAIAAVSLSFISLKDHVFYLLQVLPTASAAFADFHSNMSFVAIAHKLFGDKNGFSEPLVDSRILLWLTQALLCATLAFFVLRWLWSSCRQENTERGAFSVMVLFGLLISPISWGHYLTVMPIVILPIFSKLYMKGTEDMKYIGPLSKPLFWSSFILIGWGQDIVHMLAGIQLFINQPYYLSLPVHLSTVGLVLLIPLIVSVRE